jgi:hypothetical protein
MNNLPFTFTSGGYSAPSFDAVPFRFSLRPTYQGTAELQSAINVLSQDYVKECPTIVVGYRAGVPQILKLPCIYGGYRDVGAYVYGNPVHSDLGAYIYAQSNFLDLGGYIKSFVQTDTDLPAFIRSYTQSYTDLGAAIRRLDHGTVDLGGELHGWATWDLAALIGAHSPADLNALLNIIEIRDLPASIHGALYFGQSDLGASIYRTYLRGVKNLGAYIRSLMVEYDLPAYLNVISTSNLPAYITTFKRSTKNLGAYLYARQMKNLSASIHGYDTRDLGAIVSGVYGPYDLQAYIRVHPYLNLSATLHGWYSGVFNLKGIIEGSYRFDLSAFVNPILPMNLGAYISVVGQSFDLGALITPNIVKLKRVISISLLESRNLKGIINSFCFSSNYKDLSASLYTIYKKDLSAFIWPWKSDDGYKNLGAYINAEDYYVENKFIAKFVPNSHLMYSQLKLTFTASGSIYTVFNTQRILFGTFYAANLLATINGILRSVDLGASIEPLIQANYTELPDYVNPKSHEVVISLNSKGHENWRTFVEIMFNRGGPEPFKYFYVSGSNKVYRIDRDRHWTIWASSYTEDDTDMIDRKNMRSKFIFNLSNYTTIDAAVRDLIDRVSAYRQVDLSAIIQPILPPSADLNASITPLFRRRWVKNLPANIVGV